MAKRKRYRHEGQRRAAAWKARQDRLEQKSEGKMGASQIEDILEEVLGPDHPGLKRNRET